MNRSYAYSATEDRVENTVRILCPQNIESPAAEEKAGIREDREYTGYTASQQEVAERAHEMIMTNLERHITIAELSQTLHISATQVKSCFHKVYGMPIYAYARSQRMEAASSLLSETDQSILEIAGKFGYENGSKFAGAFRRVKGVSPSEYRRRVQWERENRELYEEKTE
jgi:AraC-like DNA-binding protein